jgi:hypothetical protein
MAQGGGVQTTMKVVVGVAVRVEVSVGVKEGEKVDV